MAVSEVSISNLALQKLGAKRITSLTEDSNNARQCNACYGTLRDRELRLNPWNFAIKRAALTPLTQAPAFSYLYAFPIPADCLRLLLPRRLTLDWKREIQDGVQVILTNDGNSINIRYIARITDPTQFDSMFVEGLACRMADHMAEQLTQSNEKKADAQAQYKLVMGEARKLDAFETLAEEPPEDSWVAARRVSRVSVWGD